MDYLVVWFVFLLTAAGGEPAVYIPPQDVHKEDMHCGLPGAVVGVHVNSLVNPSEITFPDPGFANMHCTASIAARVQGLPPGRYEIATTEMGKMCCAPLVPVEPYIGIDPHISKEWLRTDSGAPVVPRPLTPLRVSPPVP